MAHCYQNNIIDCSKQYKMVMCVKGTHEKEKKLVPVTCQYVDNRSGFIKVTAEDCDDKLFYEEYFKWLLYRGTIKEVEKVSENNIKP